MSRPATNRRPAEAQALDADTMGAAVSHGPPPAPLLRPPGRLLTAAGPVVRASGLGRVSIAEIVRIGPRRLLGEIVHLEGDVATIQVYEETSGLRVGDAVEATGGPLRAWLGPGLLGRTFDGLQRPLDDLAEHGMALLQPGLGRGGPTDPSRLRERTWRFEPTADPGTDVEPGDVLGTVAEGPVRHHILVPPGAAGGRLVQLASAGEVEAATVIGLIDSGDGQTSIRPVQEWPLRVPRPVRRRLVTEAPLLTGQRVLDMLFPVAQGGTAVIPGGFGTGKTVVEQALARYSDADVVVYVGCGERGNEMADLLATFPQLVDPRTGGALLARTVLIANTSNMPVAAREASVQLGVTIAEYFRDQGLNVALLADSTSRWAEALREISGRLEELPGEEGYPAYLASRLAAFYERAGRADVLGRPERTGSITIVGAVSPPGGDFSEPVTQASLRLAGTFWALDTELAHARHFPAISWTQSYSLYVDQLAAWYRRSIDPEWLELRSGAIELLAREKQLLEVIQLVGADALPDEDRAMLEVARLMRETFLQQSAFDPGDGAREPDVQLALLRAVLAARRGVADAIASGATLQATLSAQVLTELRRARELSGPDVAARLVDLGSRLENLAPVSSGALP